MGTIERLHPLSKPSLIGTLIPGEPPHNQQVEAALLGRLIGNNKTFVQAEMLRPEHFYYSVHGRIFGEIARCVIAGKSIDGVMLAAWLKRDPDIHDANAFVAGLLNSIVNPDITGYAELIRDLWIRRQAMEAAAELLRASQDMTQPIAEAAIAHTDQIDNLMAGETEAPDVSMDEAIISASNQVYETKKRGYTAGLKMPHYPRLNKHMAFLPEKLSIVGGESGEGKSALVWGIAVDIAKNIRDQVQRGRPLSDIGGIVGISLEMGAEALAFRALSPLSGIPVGRLEREVLQDHELEGLEQAKEQLAGLPMRLIAMGGLTPNMMRMRLRQARRKLGGKIALIVIDHVQLVNAEDKDGRGGGAWATGKVADAILNLCKEFKCHVCALSQVDSKSIAQRPDKRPTVDDLRWSANFRQNADEIWFVYRHSQHLPPRPIQDVSMDEAVYHDAVRQWEEEQEKWADRGEVYSGKQRNGESRITIPYFWEGPTTSWNEDPTIYG